MRACKTSLSKPSLLLIKTICYPLAYQFKSKATEWGLHHEDDALQAYKLETNLKVEKAGFYVDPNENYLGASPDAMVSCDCCGNGCVEVKCPYLLKHMEMGQYLDMKNSALTYVGSEVLLGREHAYYYQTQV
ncbi:hypothetical protein JTB14_030782 [Gonioctena quinquepunctata]|nr:hypothetical protein JTB14_030782 [Gonioctena quinquepunctata]